MLTLLKHKGSCDLAESVFTFSFTGRVVLFTLHCDHLLFFSASSRSLQPTSLFQCTGPCVSDHCALICISRADFHSPGKASVSSVLQQKQKCSEQAVSILTNKPVNNWDWQQLKATTLKKKKRTYNIITLQNIIKGNITKQNKGKTPLFQNYNLPIL